MNPENISPDTTTQAQSYPPHPGVPHPGGHHHAHNMPHWAQPPAPSYPHSYAPHPYNGAHPHYAPPMPPLYAQQAPYPGHIPPPYQAQAAYGYAPYYGAHPSGSHPHDHQFLHGLGSFFNFRDERFVKGAITGAAITFLLTNEGVQKNTIKSLVKFWSMLQGGVEEIKERFQDAEAEVKAEEQGSRGN
jgi:hypothetical protein